MKVKNITLLVLSFMLVSCLQGNKSEQAHREPGVLEDEDGNREFSLVLEIQGPEHDLIKKAAQTGDTDQADMTISSYKITGKSYTGLEFVYNTEQTETCTSNGEEIKCIEIEKIAPGRWTIIVEVYNTNNTAIGQGKGEVDITPNTANPDEKAHLNITVYPIQGPGTANITVTLPAGLNEPVIYWTLTKAGSPSEDIEYEITGKYVAAVITKPAGYYISRINLYDKHENATIYVGGSINIIRILGGVSINKDFIIIPNSEFGNGDIIIGINLDMKNPIEFEITGVPDTYNEGTAIEIEATSDEQIEIEYTWYLNGELQETTTYPDNTYTLPGTLPPGDYRLDVVAYNTETDTMEAGERGGSISGFFEIKELQPLSPRHLHVIEITENQITIAWEDMSKIENGYAIERSYDGKEYVTAGITVANTEIYSDTTVEPGAEYYYRARAFANTAGGYVYSEYSESIRIISPK